MEGTVVRIAGQAIPEQPLHERFPGSYPLDFFRACTGEPLPNEESFAASLRAAMHSQLCDSGRAPGEHDQFLSTGTVNGRRHGWVLLNITPGSTYQLHAHPGLEMVHIVRGELHELRLDQRLGFVPADDEQAPDLGAGGYTFSHHRHGAGSFIINEVGSTHQSFTTDAPCLLLAVWPQGYYFFPQDKLPPPGVLRDVNHRVDSELNYFVDL